MKITDVETILLRLPQVREIGDGCQTICVIRVSTDEGIVGIGEAHTNPLAAQAIIDSPLYSVSAQGLRHVLVGEDPRDINRLWDKMYRASQTYGRRGLLMHALSGIDLALWDILGKSVGLPVHQLLGGARKRAHHAYASDLSQPTLEATIELALAHKANGYRAMKFGWGALGQDRKSDVRVAEQLRKALGPDFDIMIDMGFAVPLDHALYLGRAYAEHDLYFLEEPLSPDDLGGFAKLVSASPTPIATGEKASHELDYIDLMDRGQLRIIQPDIARMGGISAMLRVIAHAEARNVRVIPHCWSTDILVAATLHCISTMRDCPYLEFNVTDNPLRTELLVEPIRPQHGVVRVPEKPGLGIELREDTLARFRWQP
ncbi:mandelate racemase/muconate lactonizing enzyme family protein [Comamonadaceae bacterium G21597-S1]|nr:mandelate racemase/muconate lactonizing enzyme family protein [Comamonadaceae bacterium G21597-S1]